VLIILPGNPVAQKRHRHCKRGNFIQTYDPSAKDKEWIIKETRKQLPVDLEYPLFKQGEPISVKITFDMQIPKQWPKSKIKRFNEQPDLYPHVFKIDLDNGIKLYTDSLNKLIYYDDSQIINLHAVKRYSHEPKTIIEIKSVTSNELSSLQQKVHSRCS
jgi:Holliday junction resolvase RusA-like endonuclease